jgi:hypothetical protein
VVGALAVVAGVGSYASWQVSREEAASDALDRVRGAYLREMGASPGALEVPELANPKAAQEIRERYLSEFQAVAESQRGTVAATLALLESADLLEALGRSEEVAAAVADGDVRLAAEERVFGLHHAEFGARLLENWNLPDPLIDAVRNHHRPRAAAVDQALCGVAHMAESVTEALASGQGLASLAPDLARWSLDLDGMAGLSVGELETLLHEELERAKDLVAA